MTHILVIGIGTTFRHDDEAGLRVAQELRKRAVPDMTILESTGDGAELLDLWQDAANVVLIDAAQSGADAGTLHSLDLHLQDLSANLFPRCSSHLFSVAEAVQMGKALGQLPPHLHLYAIEGANFSPGCGLSPEVEKAVRELTATLYTYPNH